MSARRRVAKFLKAYCPIGDVIGKYDGHLLFADDLRKLIADSKEARQWRKDYAALQIDFGRATDRITELEQETAPELPELDTTEPVRPEGPLRAKWRRFIDTGGEFSMSNGRGGEMFSREEAEQLLSLADSDAELKDEITRLTKDKQWLNDWVTGVWHALPSEFCKAGESPGQGVQRLVAELEKVNSAVAQWNGAEERWTAKENDLRMRVEAGKQAKDREAAAWQAVPGTYRAGSGGLLGAIERMIPDARRGMAVTPGSVIVEPAHYDAMRSAERELGDISNLIPNGYVGSTAQKVKRWTDLQVKKIEDLNDRLARAQEARFDLQLKLRAAEGKVAPEVNGNGVDGASRLSRWVRAYRESTPGGHGRLHVITLGEKGVQAYLDVSDIEATLRQLNEARAMAHEHKQRNEHAAKAIQLAAMDLAGQE